MGIPGFQVEKRMLANQEQNLPDPTYSIKCPHCDTELQLPSDIWYYTCDHCRARLDLKSQFAFLRGMDAFDEGQDLMTDKGPRKQRNKTRDHPVYRQALLLFVEAYSSLQVAFMSELGEVQRQVGIEMMASMTSEFIKQNMVSGLEVSYWNSLLTQQLARLEYDQLKARLLLKPSGILGFFKRLRWNTRMSQLRKKIPELDERIGQLEREIAFMDVPRVHNEKWKP
jgi:hypothetical protein